MLDGRPCFRYGRATGMGVLLEEGFVLDAPVFVSSPIDHRLPLHLQSPHSSPYHTIDLSELLPHKLVGVAYSTPTAQSRSSSAMVRAPPTQRRRARLKTNLTSSSSALALQSFATSPAFSSSVLANVHSQDTPILNARIQALPQELQDEIFEHSKSHLVNWDVP